MTSSCPPFFWASNEKKCLILQPTNRHIYKNMITDTKHHARYALMILYFFSGFFFATLFSRLPGLKEIYGFDYAHLGLIQFCMSIGSLLCMPVCANMANKYGSNRLTKMGYMVGIIFALLPIMPTQCVLFPVCMAYGICASLYDIAINGNSIIVEKSYKRAILSKFHAIYYVGTCVGAICSILFITFNVPVSVHFAITSILGFCELTIVRPFLLKEKPAKEVANGKFKLMFPKGLLLLIAFIALFSRVVEGVVSSWSTEYMKSVITLTENLAPIGLAVYAAFMSIGRFMGDFIRSRFHEPYILVVCSLSAACGLALMTCSTTLSLTLCGILVTGFGMSCLVPIIYSLAGKQKNVSPGTGIAMVNTISGTGFLLGPFLVGIIAHNLGLRASFTYVFMLAVMMLILSSVFWTKKGRPVKR